MRTITRRTLLQWLSTSVALGAGLGVGVGQLPHVGAATGTRTYDTGMTARGIDDITVAPDGNIWFHGGVTNQIGRITLDGTVTRYPMPTQRESASGAMAMRNYSAGNNVYSFPGANVILAAPNGSIWFTEYAARQIGRRDPDGTLTEYSIPDGFFDGRRGFAVGPDSSLWFRAGTSMSIGRITPNGVIRYFRIDTGPANLPAKSAGPYDLTAGPDGNMWFTFAQMNQQYTSFDLAPTLGSITPDGAVSVLPLTGYPVTGRIVYGPGGLFWILLPRLQGSGGKFYSSEVVRVTTTGINERLPNGSFYDERGVAVGADGNLWAGLYYAPNLSAKIVRITPNGEFTEYVPPDDERMSLYQIAASPDGDIVFLQKHDQDGWGRIGRLDPTRAVPLPPRM